MTDTIINSYKRCIVKIENIWFADAEFIQNIIKEKGEKNADVIVIHALNKIPDGLEGQLQYSIISDLSEHEEIMLKKINKNYRYEIRRAEKENIILKSFAGKQFLKENSLFDKF